jgi:hypothetical protein
MHYLQLLQILFSSLVFTQYSITNIYRLFYLELGIISNLDITSNIQEVGHRLYANTTFHAIDLNISRFGVCRARKISPLMIPEGDYTWPNSVSFMSPCNVSIFQMVWVIRKMKGFICCMLWEPKWSNSELCQEKLRIIVRQYYLWTDSKEGGRRRIHADYLQY